jgi:teichuronic acid biosynthesis glycosyltransferase TuaC
MRCDEEALTCRGVKVLVVAEWYPSPADPVHGIWAHRQALAARDAGADVKVLALRRPVPPIAVARQGPATSMRWLREALAGLRPLELDGLSIQPVAFLAPPRPWSYSSWGAWIAPALRRALSKESFDLLHAHNVLPTGDAIVRVSAGIKCGAARIRRGSASNAGRREGSRFVVSTHGPDIIHVAQRSDKAATTTRRTLRSAAGVIANSRWAAERCAQLAGTPLPTHVVHLGAEAPKQTLTRHSRRTVVTVAHLQARKRHEIVMRALAESAPESRPDYVIVGDGEMRGPLEALRDELGLAERVRFLGQLRHEDALQEMWRCHAFAMPSAEEPFGVAYVEAMAGGLPAIGCVEEGGPQDIAAAGDGMLLVPANDPSAVAAAISACMREGERLGAAARATVQRAFTWERCGANTVAAYEAALR